MFPRELCFRHLQPEKSQKKQAKSVKRKQKLKKCKSASITPNNITNQSITDLDSLLELSDDSDNIFKTKPMKLKSREIQINSQNVIQKTKPVFNINLKDLKFSQIEYKMGYFRNAFKGEMNTELSRFQVLENILGYK